MPNNIRTLEQRRASSAYQAIQNLFNDISKDKKDELISHIKKIPMLIKTNGIGPAFAFMLSKGELYEKIGDKILQWLTNPQNPITSLRNINNFGQLVDEITKISSYEYRTVTKEVMAYLNWLRRFADGLK